MREDGRRVGAGTPIELIGVIEGGGCISRSDPSSRAVEDGELFVGIDYANADAVGGQLLERALLVWVSSHVARAH